MRPHSRGAPPLERLIGAPSCVPPKLIIFRLWTGGNASEWGPEPWHGAARVSRLLFLFISTPQTKIRAGREGDEAKMRPSLASSPGALWPVEIRRTSRSCSHGGRHRVSILQPSRVQLDGGHFEGACRSGATLAPGRWESLGAAQIARAPSSGSRESSLLRACSSQRGICIISAQTAQNASRQDKKSPSRAAEYETQSEHSKLR